jgi:two-component system, NtrC family, nitrogen regulation sensor histidine kinase NtrY
MSYPRRTLVISLLALLSLVSGLSIQWWQEYRSIQHQELVARAESAFSQLESELNRNLEALAPKLEGNRFNERSFSTSFQDLHFPENTCLLVFESGRLRYWSDNKVLIDTFKVGNYENDQVYLLGNGFYYLKSKTVAGRKMVALLLLKQQYALQNKYLENVYHPSLALDKDVILSLGSSKEGFGFKNTRQKELFRLYFNGSSENDNCPFYISLLYGLCMIFLGLFAFDALRKLGKKRSVPGIFLLLLIVSLRIFMSWYNWPTEIFDSELFSSKYYASGFLFNSLGELLLTVVTLAYVFIFVYSWLLQSRKIESDIKSKLLIVLVFYFTFIFSVFINYLLSGLIINSQISFDINNIFQLTVFTGVGMIVIGILLSTFYLLCDGCVLIIRKTKLEFTSVAILFLVSQGLFLISLLLLRNRNLFTDYGVSAFLLANILIIFIGYIRSTEMRLFSFSRTVLVILVFSLYTAQIIYTFNETREKEKRQLLAARLENEQDIVAEFLLQGIEDRIRNDRELIRMLTLPPQVILYSPEIFDNVSRHLTKQYFNGYLGRYEARFKFFNANDLPLNRAGDPSWNIDIIKRINLTEGRPTGSSSFSYFRDDTGRAKYIGIIHPGSNDSPAGTIIIELNARSTQEEVGLPELLLSNKVGNSREFNKYAHARYQNGKLVSQSGDYNYYLTDAPYMQHFRNLDGMRFVSFDGKQHLFYKYEKNLIIISAPLQGIWVWVTLFSYLFTFFSFSFLVLSIAIRFVRQGFNLQFNFNSRIQLTITMIVAGTLLLIGAATVTYIVKNYGEAQTKRIREKLHNLRVLVESEIGNRELAGNMLSDDLQYLFTRLSGTLKTDFNFYSLDGRLYFSSQRSIYDQNIMAPLMNRTALTSLTTNQKALFIQSENISNLKYTSAYEQVRNSNNKHIGFISIPYFDRDTELKRDISGFLVALINLYVLLFSISILIAFFISNRITQPLRIIQESLSSTKLGTISEPIVWKTKDEIGALIDEYNRMLAQIQKSAQLLAKSERESAWREMAKQVAHEIKNPLTPMKLGVQHLMRAIDDNHPNKDELVKKISITMIEQIDTLSNIATEFSHFAKMPKPDYTSIELISLINHSCDLYGEDHHVKIIFKSHPESLEVTADKDQLIRIFGNLIKNGIQAIPKERTGEIEISLDINEDWVTICIKDNGLGIPDDMLSKIFVPNFTTKSSGAGLGLAMVKEMVVGMGGQIWFETKQNVGTSFFLKLQRSKK